MESDLPNELSARVKFNQVVKRFEKIAATRDHKQKVELVGRFFKSIFSLQQQFRDNEGPNADASFYPFLRLFVPWKDSERGSFGIQIPTLGRLFVKAEGLNSKGETALKLTNLQGTTADYGDIVYEIMKNRSPAEGTLTVYEVNKYLDLIADHFRDNERNKIDTEIVTMLKGMSAVERKWLTRILLKHLKLGVGDKQLLNLYHSRAFDLYAQCNHLSDVCKFIESNVAPQNEPSNGLIQIFRPVRPMLCERGSINQINQMLARNDYYLETKMDGERCQVHVNGTEFKYYSRGCKDDLTEVFGSTGRTGLFSPFFYGQLNRDVKNAIFDGEMMVWDNEENSMLKKTENFTAKHLKDNDQKLIPCYCIYDLIYVNGVSLTAIPYAERIRKLKGLIRVQAGALMLCERTKLRDAGHFLECLNKAFDANEEGVVIKQEDSKYQPGHREKGGWFKMKPDYENSLISDFDLLIVGGFYNDNRTKIDSFLLAVLKKGENADGDAAADVFHAACKIRNGFSRAQFREIAERLQPYKHEISATINRPHNIDWANANPDVWYDPEHSIVVQIKASELVETTTYRTSHYFRFPRVMAIRWDKPFDEVCTLNEFQTFCSSRSKVEKLTKRHATTDDLNKPSLPKRQRTGPEPPAALTPAALIEIQPVDSICSGLEFCVAVKSGPSAAELKNMVRRHGGSIVEYPGVKTFVVIADNPKMAQVAAFIRSKKYNIAKSEWLRRALGSDKPLTALIKFTPNDLLFVTEQLQQQFDADPVQFDEYDTPPVDLEASIDSNSKDGGNAADE